MLFGIIHIKSFFKKRKENPHCQRSPQLKESSEFICILGVAEEHPQWAVTNQRFWRRVLKLSGTAAVVRREKLVFRVRPQLVRLCLESAKPRLGV